MTKQQGARLSAAQIELATKMNSSGIEWQMIAHYFKVSNRTLLKDRKHYEQELQQTE